MRIQHNISALNTHRNLAFNNAQTSKALEKLSSGYKINRAGDDAAGLAISEKMRGQIRGLDMASKNAQDGISLIQTAEGALNETHSILQRMRELAVQAGNDTNTTGDREEIQKEINQLTSEINRIGNTTEFNTKKLVNGELSEAYSTSEATTSKFVTAKAGQEVKIGETAATWTTAEAGAAFNVNVSGKAGGAGAEVAWADASTAEITITKNSTGFTLNAEATDTANTALITSATLQFDAAKKEYSYSGNGISFSFKESDAKDWATGSTVTLDLTKVTYTAGAASVNTKSDVQNFSTNGTSASGVSSLSNFKVSSAGTNLQNLGAVKIEYDAGNNKVIVDLLDNTTAANSLGKFEYNDITAGETLNFSQNGISFDFKAATAAATAEGTFKLQTEEKDVVVPPADAKDNSVKFQIGANKDQAIAVSLEDMRASALGITTKGTDAKFGVTDGTNSEVKEQALDITSHEKAAQAIETIDAAITKVSAERSKLGAVQNRLDHTINNLGTSSENLTAAESRIRDTDMAASMMNFTKNNILTQAAQSMLAQANQQPQGVLQLLG